VDSSPAVSPDGSTVFVGSDDKKVYALIATTGAQRWAFATGGAVRSSPAVSPDGATVFVSSYDAQVYALNSNPPCSPGSSGPNGGANGKRSDENFIHSYEVRITLSLPMSLSGFTKHKQKAFKASLRHAANLEGVVVSEAVVITKIESISSRRHLLEEHIRVETSLMTTDKAIAEARAGDLTANSINRELSMACPQLPKATVLEAAKVTVAVAITQWPSPTNEAKECSFEYAVMGQLPIIFFCGLAYLGVKSKCSFAPKKTKPKADKKEDGEEGDEDDEDEEDEECVSTLDTLDEEICDLETQSSEMLPTTGDAAPSQTPETNSSTAIRGSPTMRGSARMPSSNTEMVTTQGQQLPQMLQMGQQGPPTSAPLASMLPGYAVAAYACCQHLSTSYWLTWLTGHRR